MKEKESVLVHYKLSVTFNRKGGCAVGRYGATAAMKMKNTKAEKEMGEMKGGGLVDSLKVGAGKEKRNTGSENLFFTFTGGGA
jgi:hypothetical protein